LGILNQTHVTNYLVSFFGFQENAFSGRAASRGALAPEPLRATRIQPEPYGFSLISFFFTKISG